MTHAALLELLTEGYIVFRRVLSTVSTVQDSVSLMSRERARYQLVQSDTSYLYLLGKSYLDSIYGKTAPFDVSLCVLTSIDDTLDAISSYDASSVIIEFARQLGLNAQENDPSFAATLGTLLSKTGAVIHRDPAMQLAIDGVNALDAKTSSILEKLNVPTSTWKDIVSAAANSTIMRFWQNALDKASSVRIHKSNLFISLVYAAAHAVSSRIVSDIELSGGRDALVLAAPVVLSFERQSLQYPSKLKPIPMLTTAMINSYSDNVMRSRDYVRTVGGTWEPKSRVIPVLPGSDVKYDLALPSVESDITPTASASAMVIGAIKSSITKKAQTEVSKAGNKAARTVQAGALRWLRKKNIKL